MNGRTAVMRKRPTRLTGKKDGITFEIWVEIDGKPLEVFGEADSDDGGSEAWITSKEGKVCLPGTVTSVVRNLISRYGSAPLFPI